MNYVSLHNRSAFSFGSALTTPKQLVRFAKKQGMSAIALTDLNGLYAAIDASPEMGRVVLDCSNADGSAIISVTDKGCGMPAEVQEHIFEPFYTTKNAGEGTGLGLFIGHKIVTDHEGEITLSSSEGVGTTIRVKLPVLESADISDGKATTAA